MTGEFQQPTPSTHLFKTYIEQHVRPLLRDKYSRPQVSVMVDLLMYLEQQRYDFSADRAFQTRPISNASIAALFDVTERSVRRWMSQLEELGILKREHRKNPRSKYKNLLNRIRFTSFWEWIKVQARKAQDNQSPPRKKDIKNINLRLRKNGEIEKSNTAFPSSGSIAYDIVWKELAEKHLPAGRSRPCKDMIARNFRENLKLYGIALDHPSVKQRWINFCQRAKPVH